jgi:hypothetical protein
VITADTLPKPTPIEPDVKPPATKADEPTTNGSSQRGTADTDAPAPAQNPPTQNPPSTAQAAQPASTANQSANAPPCNPKARYDDTNCLAGGPAIPLTGPQGATPQIKPAQPKTVEPKPVLPKPVQPKPVQPKPIDPTPAASASASPPPAPATTANAQPVNIEEQSPVAAPQDRKQDRTRSSSRRRDRGNWDEGRSASNYWGAPDEDVDRGYGSRRDRYGERDRYGDDDRYRGDRRSARRGGGREEERVVERGPRIGGSPGLFGLLPFLGGD